MGFPRETLPPPIVGPGSSPQIPRESPNHTSAQSKHGLIDAAISLCILYGHHGGSRSWGKGRKGKVRTGLIRGYWPVHDTRQ